MLRSYLIDGVLAGAMVSVGGAVLLSCDNRYLGAFLFCIRARSASCTAITAAQRSQRLSAVFSATPLERCFSAR